MMNENELIDIYDMWYQPFWLQPWFFYTVIMIMSSAIGYLLWHVYKKYVYKKRVVDCASIALKDIDSLKKIHIVTLADSKDCYFRLSLILKQYLSLRYKILCLPLTDIEIVQQTHAVMSQEQLKVLQDILQSMTFVKFEHEQALDAKFEQDIQIIIQFIDMTTPQLSIEKRS